MKALKLEKRSLAENIVQRQDHFVKEDAEITSMWSIALGEVGAAALPFDVTSHDDPEVTFLD